MRALLVARTIGPAKNLVRVASALSDRNHEVAAVLSKDPESMIYAPALMSFNPDAVLVTTSSMNISDELAVIVQARQRGIPYAIFADTYGAHNRSEMPEEMKRDCSVVFVPDETEKEFSREIGYPRAEVSGVPIWEDYADLSNYPSRGDIRGKLGISDEEIAVVSAFGKDGNLNRRLLQDTVKALRMAIEATKRHFIFIPRFHPGDQSLKTDPNFYKEVLDGSLVRIIDSSAYKSADDIMPAMDLIVSQFSTIGINAIYQRKPVIEYMIDPVLERLEKQTGRR
ncbi:MAG: hypothetical protein AAB885_03160, partial [Patescibacteria group bacterium]